MLRQILLTIGILSIPLPLWSEKQTSNDDKKTPVLMHKNKNNQKPTGIDDDNLSCTYVGGKLQFEYATPEGNSNVSVHKLDTGELLSSQNCNSKFSVAIGETSGFYEIIVNTSEGGTYSGYLSID